MAGSGILPLAAPLANDDPRTAAAAEWKRHWPLVLAATAGMSLAALSTASIGVMLIPIQHETGWSRAAVSSGPLLISFMVVLTGTLVGFAIDRFGPRVIACIAVALLCSAVAGMSQIGGNIWVWRGLWAMIGLASAAMPTVWLKPITSCFRAARGLALAIVLTGSGITSTVVPLLATRLMEDHGWRQAYILLALIWATFVLPLVLAFLRIPREADPQTQTALGGPMPGLTVREGFTSPVFYQILFGTVASTFVGTAMVLNLIPMLRATGIPAESAAGVVSFIGLSTIVGRISGGWFMDRYPAKQIAAIAVTGMIALPATLLFLPGQVVPAIAAVVVYGLMGGIMTPTIAYLTSQHLGARSFGTLYATINAAFSIGVGVGPLLANHAYDLTGSYVLVFWVAMPLFALGALAFLTLGAYPDFGEAAD